MSLLSWYVQHFEVNWTMINMKLKVVFYSVGCLGRYVLLELGQWHSYWCLGSLCHQAITSQCVVCLGQVGPSPAWGSISSTTSTISEIIMKKANPFLWFLKNNSKHDITNNNIIFYYELIIRHFSYILCLICLQCYSISKTTNELVF